MAAVSRSTVMRLAAALAVAVVLAGPLASAYESDIASKDNSAYVRAGTCYCHTPLPADNVSLVLRVPEQVAVPTSNQLVRIEVGILAPVMAGKNIAFGLFLNASNTTNLRWDTSSFLGPPANITASMIRINGTVAFNSKPLPGNLRWFNGSFNPGLINQTIEVKLVGMYVDRNANATGDVWAVKTAMVEVRKQRLVSLNVTVRNKEPVAVSNVPVAFYIDDVYIGRSSIPSIEPESSANVTMRWDATFAKDGWHDMRAVIDPDGNVTETDKGNNEVNRRIWLGEVEEQPDRTPIYAAIAIVVVAVLVMVGFWYYRKRLYQL